MSETPNPTLEELEDYDALTNGDIGMAQDEILRRLEALLPLWIAHKNVQKGWMGPDAIELPVGYGLAPAVLTDSFLNFVLVGVKVETTPQGIGGTFRNQVQLVISSVDRRLEDEQQVRTAWARAEAIRTCLRPFLSGCNNASGESCWRQLEPRGYSMLPGEWAKEYSGTSVVYDLIQSPR